MAKKVQVEEVQPVPTNDQVIDTSIDMKLTKQDLIDVVVEETREQLENQVDDARDAYEAEKLNIDKARTQLNKTFKEAVETKYAKELKLLKDNGKLKSPNIIDGGNWGRNGLVATEHGVYSVQDLRDENVRTSKGHYARRTITESGKIVDIKITLPEVYEISSNNEKNGDEEDETQLFRLNMDLRLRLSKSEASKLFAPFVKQVKLLGELKVNLNKLEEQLKSVDKMGKKAKTQLIKRILASSDGGQALLSNIGAIKAGVGQLLLESTK